MPATRRSISVVALARRLRAPPAHLQDLLRREGFRVSETRLGPVVRHRVTKEIEAVLAARMRRVSHADRMRATGSKYWLSGYPKLIAQWHPTKNGGFYPDEISYGSGRRVWWKCAKGPDHEW